MQEDTSMLIRVFYALASIASGLAAAIFFRTGIDTHSGLIAITRFEHWPLPITETQLMVALCGVMLLAATVCCLGFMHLAVKD